MEIGNLDILLGKQGEMTNINILHIASFDGNIGDNANHNGFYKQLNKNLPTFNFKFTEHEIREYFWGKKFDDQFIELANKFDLLIFGGGNYFELWVKSSCNSTTIDIPINILEKITPPILFNALGVDPHQGIARKHAFTEWINYVASNPNKYLITVRNDGAAKNLMDHFDQHFVDNFISVPDGGFFIDLENCCSPLSNINRPVVGINIAGDMLDERFNKEQSKDEFISDLCELIVDLIQGKDVNQFVLFPHIYKDLHIIDELINKLPDPILRRHIQVAPYLHGTGMEKSFFAYYRDCDLIWANRFHANVCSIGLGIPVIGLANYPQIPNLYEEIGIENSVIDIAQKNSISQLKKKTLSYLNRPEATIEILKDLNINLNYQVKNVHTQIEKWLLNQPK